ncbi:leucine-rich repeat protein [Plasmodium sp. gorilla clade G2]|uniref:leucine-rich repeat protein n=1 Tax=Plasmodium sp. gorilla clade G2 TaxID=880535 RepID=UPI000D222163|nr:leucine-rich repeat protein [Plasmodium sp. gorilla clade G2]SOV14000.1 leucine-rich repeat protein [Plasmodium sp. gorilla clade G2]
MNEQNYHVNDKQNTFLFYEKIYEGDDRCLFNIIISFKKLKIYNEKDFEEVINLNGENILKDIVKIEEQLQRNTYNNEITKEEKNKSKSKNKNEKYFDIDEHINKEMDNININQINYNNNNNKYDICDDIYKNCKNQFDIINAYNNSNINSHILNKKSEREEKKLCVIWDLDLSYNYFKEISLDNIFSIMIKKNIISDKNIIQLNNLRTLNLRKNNLIYFPYISKFVLDGLIDLYISHNYIEGCKNYMDEMNNMKNVDKNIYDKEINNKINNNINNNNNLYYEGMWNNIVPNLKNIYLQNNYLESFFSLKYLINKHKNIKYINISFNKINFLTDLFILKNVEHINLSYNTFMNLQSNMTSDGLTKNINNIKHKKNDINNNNNNNMDELIENDEEISINVDHTIKQKDVPFYLEGRENRNMLNLEPTYKNNYDNDNKIIFHNFLLNLKIFFPCLKNLNIKYTAVYYKFKLYIKKEDYKDELNCFIDFK